MFYSETLVAVTPASRTTAACLRSGGVYDDLSAFHGLAVELLDCSLGFSLCFHLDESKAALSSGITIGRDGDRYNLSGLCKQFFQVSLIQAEGDVPHE